jgi:hypothetical protein
MPYETLQSGRGASRQFACPGSTPAGTPADSMGFAASAKRAHDAASVKPRCSRSMDVRDKSHTKSLAFLGVRDKPHGFTHTGGVFGPGGRPREKEYLPPRSIFPNLTQPFLRLASPRR